jgi:hypothetical protein
MLHLSTGERTRQAPRFLEDTERKGRYRDRRQEMGGVNQIHIPQRTRVAKGIQARGIERFGPPPTPNLLINLGTNNLAQTFL